MRFSMRTLCVMCCLLLTASPSLVQAAPRGLAIAIGLNSVDPAHYGGWSGVLQACEFDAEDMAAIAVAQGFEAKKLLTAAATRQAVLDELSNAGSELVSGDILVVSYSGHGGQVPDQNGDEIDNEDETWCLFDGEVLDDELAAAWATFAPGVRIVVFSDSCHSGTVTKMAEYERLLETVAIDPLEDRKLLSRFDDLLSNAVDNESRQQPSPLRAMPASIAAQTYRQNKAFYDGLGAKVQTELSSKNAIKCTVILISGCQDNQLSYDGTFNGRFTGKLKQAWANGAFNGDYSQFHSTILMMMPPYQSPNYYVIGALNPAFEGQKPWTK